MTIEIYWGSGSPNAWRVLLAAETLRIPYESKLLEFSKGQHRTPEFLALNPRGKVPVLREGDFVLYESLAILEYLDRLAAVYPYARLLLRAITKAEARARELSLFPFFDAFPGLGEWFGRVEELPGYERTFPPHWRAEKQS